jgi:2-polyprenyl-3-methyl-5-hydroxy-6-metoxy-1,4-benzoquinol methylase
MNIATADNDVRFVPGEQSPTSRSGLMHKSRYDWLTTTIDVKSKSILDFGCGSGYGPAFLTAKGARVLGIDISAAAIQYAKETYPGALFLRYDLTDSHLVDHVNERFDVVVSFDVIEHVEKWWIFLENIRLLLKQSGIAFVGCPNRVALYDFNAFWNPHHLQEFTPVQLDHIARTVFKDVTVMGQRFRNPAARQFYMARPLGLGHYVKGAMKQTPFRAPAVALERLVRHDLGATRIRGGAVPQQDNEIVFEQVDMQDEANTRDPFGLVAICRI